MKMQPWEPTTLANPDGSATAKPWVLRRAAPRSYAKTKAGGIRRFATFGAAYDAAKTLNAAAHKVGEGARGA